MTEKIVSLCLLAVLPALRGAAQGADRPGDLPLMAVVPSEGIPAGTAAVLRTKLLQIASADGLGTLDDYAQFGLMVGVQPETQEIVAGAPPMIAQTLLFTFYIGDRFADRLYCSSTQRVKGVGSTPEKAYMQAVRRIDPASLRDFAAEGRRKIIEYYTANCDNIIATARSLAGQRRYEEALFYLTQVPEVCGECYAKALTAAGEVYQEYVDYLCVQNLAAARAAWAAQQNAVGAAEAGEYLQHIYPDASCYNDAMALYKEIKGKVLDDWKFVMKVYQDGVDLESQRIRAMRDVGVEWGRNQRPVTYAPNWIVR